MSDVLRERRDDIATAMRGLCDAVGRFALVRDDLITSLQDKQPGHPDEQLALALSRTCTGLTEAAAKLPHECWDILIHGNMVGGEEVRKRVDTMIQNTMIMNEYAGARLAVGA